MRHDTPVWHWDEPIEVLRATLSAGGMLAIPTESTYGLAVDPRQPRGVEAIQRFKRRPAGKGMPVVLAEIEQLRSLGGDPESPHVRELAALWPAALTLVVPIAHPLPATAGSASVAVRVPAHDRLRQLLAELGLPLTATSANISGQEPVSSARVLRESLKNTRSIIIDDGDLAGEPVSTILRPEGDGYRILREGALPAAWLRRRLPRPVFSAAAAEIPAEDRLDPA